MSNSEEMISSTEENRTNICKEINFWACPEKLNLGIQNEEMMSRSETTYGDIALQTYTAKGQLSFLPYA